MLGVHAVQHIGPEARAMRCTHAMVLTDAGMLKTNALGQITSSLEAEGIDITLFDRVAPETPARVVNDGARLAKDKGCDLVIAVGGGTTLDTTKGVSLLATNPGKVLDYEGMDRVSCKGLPKIMIPTTAGSGSEVTRVFAVTDEKSKRKCVVYSEFNLADMVILDPAMTLTLPPKLTAETGLDALIHAIEAYTSRNGTPFSDMLGLETVRLAGKGLVRAYEQGDDMEARSNMLLAATLGGLAFSSGGLGAVHALSFELETAHGIGHARAAAMMLPHVMHYNKTAAKRKFMTIATALGEDTHDISEDQGAEKAVRAIQTLLKTLHISTRFSDYGISPKDVPGMAERAARQKRLFGNNARDVRTDDIKDIYMEGFR